MKFLNKIKSFFFPRVRYFKKTEIEFLEAAINRYNKRLRKIMSKCDCGGKLQICFACISYMTGDGRIIREKISRIEKQLVILRAREKAKDETTATD